MALATTAARGQPGVLTVNTTVDALFDSIQRKHTEFVGMTAYEVNLLGYIIHSYRPRWAVHRDIVQRLKDAVLDVNDVRRNQHKAASLANILPGPVVVYDPITRRNVLYSDGQVFWKLEGGQLAQQNITQGRRRKITGPHVVTTCPSLSAIEGRGHIYNGFTATTTVFPMRLSDKGFWAADAINGVDDQTCIFTLNSDINQAMLLIDVSEISVPNVLIKYNWNENAFNWRVGGMTPVAPTIRIPIYRFSGNTGRRIPARIALCRAVYTCTRQFIPMQRWCELLDKFIVALFDNDDDDDDNAIALMLQAPPPSRNKADAALDIFRNAQSLFPRTAENDMTARRAKRAYFVLRYILPNITVSFEEYLHTPDELQLLVQLANLLSTVDGLAIRLSGERGYGLFATRDFRADSPVTLYGNRFGFAEVQAEIKALAKKDSYVFGPWVFDEAFFGRYHGLKRKTDKKLWLKTQDECVREMAQLAPKWNRTKQRAYATSRLHFRLSEKGRWINHYRDPDEDDAPAPPKRYANTVYRVECHDDWGTIGITVKAGAQGIEEGAELLVDYGDRYWKDDDEDDDEDDDRDDDDDE